MTDPGDVVAGFAAASYADARGKQRLFDSSLRGTTMFTGRGWAWVVMTATVAVAIPGRDAGASPARRLARRGIVAPEAVVLPAPVAVVPSPFLLRPAPLVVAGLPPAGTTLVVGPRGRVRSVIVSPGAAPPSVVAITAAAANRPAESVATTPSSPAPRQAVAAPERLPAEPIAAPLPTPRTVTADEVVPAGAELDIPDGTRSVLVEPADGSASRSTDR